MNQTPNGPDNEVREALAAAVGSYGPAVLGNAQMLGNILTDLLPDHPRERSLLVAAAEAEAATLLQEQVGRQHLDAGTAVALTARTLMERRALDPTAARWVTTAYATALGYNPPPAEPAPPVDAPPPGGPLNYVPTQGIGQPALPDAPTLIGPPPSSSLPPQGAGPQGPAPGVFIPQQQSMPPAAPPAAPPPGAYFGPPGGQSLPPAPGFGPPGSSAPTAPLPPWNGGAGVPGGVPVGLGMPGGPGGPVGFQQGGGAAAPKRQVALIVTAAAAGVALVAYLALAGATHLPPFQKTAGHSSNSVVPSPSDSTSPSPSFSDSGSPSPTGPVLADGVTPIYTILASTLSDPATQCQSTTNYGFVPVGLVSAYSCSDTALPGGTIWAYQMDNQADYQASWVNFNKWWGFNTNTAGGNCPPSGSSVQGLSEWHNDALGYPYLSGQVLECSMVGNSGSNNQPAYTWTLPTQNGFFVAAGASGSAWSTLNTWWQKDAPPGASASPAPAGS